MYVNSAKYRTLMSLNGILTLFLTAFLLSGCSPKMKVTNSTMQHWMGGAAGSGGGTNYAVLVSKPTDGVVKIEKVWLGDREKGIWPRFSVQKDSSGTRYGDKTAPAGIECFTVSFSKNNPARPDPRNDLNEGPNIPKDEPAPTDLPEDFSSGAVIFYSYGTKLGGTWIVNDFTVLQPLAYP